MTEDNGCKVELTIGESNPVPGPRRPMANGLGFPGLLPPADGTSGRCFLLTEQGLCMDNFGNETALLFGAYRGAAGLQDSYLDGFESSLALCCVSVAACLLVGRCKWLPDAARCMTDGAGQVVGRVALLEWRAQPC